MEEQQAVARLKRGDIGGLEALVGRYQVRAVRAAYLVTRDRALAEDIVQAAFLKAYECISQFDAARPFGPWFLRIVVNDAIKAAARRERHVSLETASIGRASLIDLLADPNVGPADQVETGDMRQTVWDALGRLPPMQRAAIVLRYYLGLSESEMTEELACPLGTVKWRLHAARNRLRALLRPLWLATAESKGQEWAAPFTSSTGISRREKT
jgi:RNA polymerase sigma-70 factor (ECF subfamily)